MKLKFKTKWKQEELIQDIKDTQEVLGNLSDEKAQNILTEAKE